MVDAGSRRKLAVPGRRVLGRPPTERELTAERIAARLDIPFTALGIVAVLVFVAERSSPPGSGLRRVLLILGLLMVLAFVFEFVLRVIIAPSTGAFLRRNWWQLIFLVLPFFRVFRISRATRLARLASSSIGPTRSARGKLTSRLAWVGTVTASVILASSELLDAYGQPTTYPQALHDAALATLGGEPIGRDGAVPQVLEVFLILYSVVVFAALAGTLGAFFIEDRLDDGSRRAATRSAKTTREQG